MNNLIINSTKLGKSSITAHSRNALVLSNELKIKLISTKEEIDNLNISNYNKFIISGAGFYPETAYLESIIRKSNNPLIIWLNNDYNVSPNPEYLRLMKDYRGLIISNTEFFNIFKHFKTELLNLNTLLYLPPNQKIFKKYNCIYYGTYRPKRRIYFQRYFQDNYIYISSSAKNLKKYKFLAGSNSIWLDKLSWEFQRESLNLFKYSLYLEDEYTHTHYNHLANRFYEALHCNNVQFFDINCKNTIEKSNIIFDNYFYVKNLDELKLKIKNDNFEESLNFQKQWNIQASKERNYVLNKIKDILNE